MARIEGAETFGQGRIIDGCAATYCTGAFVTATVCVRLWRCVTVRYAVRDNHAATVMIAAGFATVTTIVCALARAGVEKLVAGLQR